MNTPGEIVDFNLAEGWKLAPLEDLFDILRNATSSRAEYSADGQVACVHYGDIHVKWNCFLDFASEQVPGVSEAKARSIPRLRDGDLVVVDTSEDDVALGKCVEVRNLGDREAVAGLHTLLLRPKDARLEEGFKSYVFESSIIKKQVRALAVGIKVYSLTRRAARNIRVPLPPNAEQRAIAAALSQADELIAALDALIAKKSAMKKGAMEQLLTGRIRLPTFSGQWDSRPFGEFVRCRRESTARKDIETDALCIDLEHVESGTGRLLGSSSAGAASSSRLRFQRGDVLFGKLRAYLKKYWLATQAGICSTEFWVFAPKAGEISSEYLFQIVMTDSFAHAAAPSYGTHMPRSDWRLVSQYLTNLPPIPEQNAIAETLYNMDGEVSDLQRRRTKLEAVRQGMMQSLLTGGVRLVTPLRAENVPSMKTRRT